MVNCSTRGIDSGAIWFDVVTTPGLPLSWFWVRSGWSFQWTLRELSKIEPGAWTRADVEREFGPPARVDGVASWTGDILNYRWRDSDLDMLFYVYLDANNRVQRIGQGMEFLIRMNDNDN